MKCVFAILLSLLVLLTAAEAQGPAPETAPPLFPKGALISYGSDFFSRSLTQITDPLSPTNHPTFSHRGNFVFTWGFYPNFDLTVTAPVVTNRFKSDDEIGGTGLGDTMMLLKYRFYRRDSDRGTTQASLTAGPKLPTGRTGLRDPAGNRLPASLQPGSGSTDVILGMNWTYTGLFNIRRLVADEDFHSLLRTTGAQQTRLGSELESRFWLSYRPYESSDIRHEWFVGPTVTWLHSQDVQVAGIRQPESGGDVVLAGMTTYIGLSPGIHAWLGVEWSVARSNGRRFTPVRRHISAGITRQFRFF